MKNGTDQSNIDLAGLLRDMRSQLEKGFSAETAQHGRSTHVPSAGQCAAVAVILREILGGELVSARVEDKSHWFNRLRTPEGEIDVDITADQFGHAPIRISHAGDLYPDTRLRLEAEVSGETRTRSELLKKRTGVSRASLGKIVGTRMMDLLSRLSGNQS